MAGTTVAEIGPGVRGTDPHLDQSAPPPAASLSTFIRSRPFFPWLLSEAPKVAKSLRPANEMSRLEADAVVRPELLQAVSLGEKVLNIFDLHSKRQDLLVKQWSDAKVKLQEAKTSNEETSQSLRGQVRNFVNLYFRGNRHLQCLEPTLTRIVADHAEQIELYRNVESLISHPTITQHIVEALSGGLPKDLTAECFRNTLKRLVFNIAALSAENEPLILSSVDDPSINLPVPLVSPSVYDRAAAVRELLVGSPDHQELQRQVEAFVATARTQLETIEKVRHGLYEAVCQEVGVPAV